MKALFCFVMVIISKSEMGFELKSDFKPDGDQPKAIKGLCEGLNKGFEKQTLLGVTGSGKTFTMANVINFFQRPTLVLAHNKTLAFQLYTEFKEFFPKNKVEYFISYYDYYQPESYIPSTDTYIEKDAQINPKIELMRLSATTSLLSRRDVIVVASVSAIYGLGNPKSHKELVLRITKGDNLKRNTLIEGLLNLYYERNDTELLASRFRVRGNVVDIFLSFDNKIIRVGFIGDVIQSIKGLDKDTMDVISEYEDFDIYPAKHFVTSKEETLKITKEIERELNSYLPELENKNPIFAYRLKQKIMYDIEMMNELGYCKGIENYSRYFDKRKSGERPYCLLDYFPDDFLMFIDESHQTIPQIRGMFNGDKSRKETLIEYGFRLPSALDNRPLQFNEFERFLKRVVFVSATPSEYEIKSSKQIVEQIIRPTGLIDPEIVIKDSDTQIKDVLEEIKKTVKEGYRILVTTLTKKLSEEITDFFASKGIRVRYLHSEIDSIERSELIRQLRLGEFDVIVGINLLREGLDIPEVGLVAILDADKEGFLRDERSLIQTIGRAARNSRSRVILYAKNITGSIKRAVAETNRRRVLQIAYNQKRNIIPKSIVKPISTEKIVTITDDKMVPKSQIPNLVIELESQMRTSAERLDFEMAIKLREKIKRLKEKHGL